MLFVVRIQSLSWIRVNFGACFRYFDYLQPIGHWLIANVIQYSMRHRVDVSPRLRPHARCCYHFVSTTRSSVEENRISFNLIRDEIHLFFFLLSFASCHDDSMSSSAWCVTPFENSYLQIIDMTIIITIIISPRWHSMGWYQFDRGACLINTILHFRTNYARTWESISCLGK